MKLILKKNKEGKTCGWTFEAETEDERLCLGTIRHYEFWGTGDDKPKYDGITTEGDYVTTVSYKIPSQTDKT